MTDVFSRRGGATSAGWTRRLAGVASVVLLASAGLPTGVLADPPSTAGPVEVSSAVQHDVSPPLRVLGPTAPSAATLRERPLRLVGPGSSPAQPDGAVQAAPATAVATTAGLNFAGVGQGEYGFTDQYAPPDTNGAVGATQYVQWVNTYLAVFDKSSGAIAAGFPKAGNAVWAGFGGGCEANNDGDPIVQYDKAANRWILTQFSVATTPYLQCVAVSQTSNATGAYNRYAFSYTQFPDYPKLGVWPDAYYITFNMFTSTFVGPKVCAYDRAGMLAGSAVTQQCFQLGSGYGSILPGDLDGATLPPAGAPNPLLALAGNSLNLWRFHVDWANAANTTLSGPLNIPVATFSRACNGSNCVPQPSTNQKLDSLGDRLMYRLAYRNFGDHESLVVNHSVSVGGNFFQSGVSSVRWYELRGATSGAPAVVQQGTLDASDGIHRWMGSIAMDKSGDIAVGYSASNGSLYPSIRYTGRTSSDAPGTMQAENVIQVGSGSQLQNLSRWGDYSAMTVDPVDDCTFWYTSEYLKTSGTWNWNTRIASFKFPGCAATATLTITTTSLPAGTVNQSYSQTVAATGGTPPYTWSITSGALPSGLTLATSTGTISGTPTTAGTSSFSVTATDSSTPTAQAVTQALTIAVNPATATLTITTTSLPAGTVNQSYSQTVAATGGTPPYTWSITSGALPSGLTLATSTGTISGTPAKPGNYSFTVTVIDSSTPIKQTATQSLSIRISRK